MYLVTGGVVDVYNEMTSTTEVMAAEGATWSYAGNLPRPTHLMAGITLNNQMFLTGVLYQEPQ